MLAVVAALACAPAPAQAPLAAPRAVAPPAPPPNILVILADDVGTDKIAVYKEHPNPPATPNIDALAARGVLYRNAYAYPICSPSRAALLTGRYGRRNGLGAIIEWTDTWELPLAEVTIPEMLDRPDRDWATAAAGKWHLSAPKTPSALLHPNLQGFDHYRGAIHNLYFDDSDERSNYFSYDKVIDGTSVRVEEYATTATTDDALSMLRSMHAPWFLYVAYNAAHSPFHVPPGADLPPKAPVPRKYAAMIEKMDAEIGRLLGALPPEELARTVVFFLGDNGTPPEAVLPPRLPAQAKHTLFEGGTNVPLIVAGPGVAQGRESAALVHFVDVLPTIAALAGIDPTVTGKTLDGTSFAGTLADPAAPGNRRFVYTERLGETGPPPHRLDWRAIRDDRYKLADQGKGWKLYDLQGRFDDGPPKDVTDLTPQEKQHVAALQAELGRIAATVRFEY
jgi:arylsulfatase A-like enzyme